MTGLNVSKLAHCRARDQQCADSGGSELLDEALARVARLEAALAMTGGTVHDVNNLLTVLSGNLFILTELVRNSTRLYQKMRVARNTAEKCGTLMRELLTFSRGTDSSEQSICPANHVLALEPLLCRSVRSSQSLEISAPDEPWSAAVSAVQFESAVTNLVINARDALRDDGNIRVDIENVVIGSKQRAKLQLECGNYIRVRVTDNGVGIPAEILPHVAEPLYSTKKNGNGTGLGLSMVQRFARKNNGAFSICSKEGKGTQATIWLPKCQVDAEITANMTLPLTALQGGDETVLLVTRDEDVRGAIREILSALGYNVILSAFGKPLPTDLQGTSSSAVLVCDRSIDQRRKEVAWIEALRKQNPALRHVAILTSDNEAKSVAPDADATLRRPIAVPQLAEAMRCAVGS